MSFVYSFLQIRSAVVLSRFIIAHSKCLLGVDDLGHQLDQSHTLVRNLAQQVEEQNSKTEFIVGEYSMQTLHTHCDAVTKAAAEMDANGVSFVADCENTLRAMEETATVMTEVCMRALLYAT